MQHSNAGECVLKIVTKGGLVEVCENYPERHLTANTHKRKHIYLTKQFLFIRVDRK